MRNSRPSWVAHDEVNLKLVLVLDVFHFFLDKNSDFVKAMTVADVFIVD